MDEEAKEDFEAEYDEYSLIMQSFKFNYYYIFSMHGNSRIHVKIIQRAN